MKKIFCSSITPEIGTTLSYVGPALDRGPMPSVFYFALSSEESLCQDPYNQPVQFLTDFPLRIFSCTLPYHDLGLKPNQALEAWAEDCRKKKIVIEEFVEKIRFCLSFLVKENIIEKTKTALMGLSRGCFFCCHVAAVEPDIPFLLHFAPLTKLSYSQYFKNIKGITQYDVHHLKNSLYNRIIRTYIGNRDIRVGTDNAFSFCQQLVDEAYLHHIRSAPIELIISPSIGHQGHGTSLETFNHGALWLGKLLIEKK
jgi:hypothetical protein